MALSALGSIKMSKVLQLSKEAPVCVLGTLQYKDLVTLGVTGLQYKNEER